MNSGRELSNKALSPSPNRLTTQYFHCLQRLRERARHPRQLVPHGQLYFSGKPFQPRDSALSRMLGLKDLLSARPDPQ